MAKGASTENQLGSLHMKLTLLFTNIIQRYETQLDAANSLNMDDVGEEMLAALMEDKIMPSPAMLSAISKFLKDNEITMETEQLNALSVMEERLIAKQKARPSLASVTSLPLQNNG